MLDPDGKHKAASVACEVDWTPQNNYAAKVLLAYLVSLDLTDPSTKNHQIGAHLLSTASFSVAQRLNALFLETLSPLGNPHSEAIPLLMQKLAESDSIEEELVKGALDSLDRLDELVKGLGPLMVRKSELGKYKDKIIAMNKAAESARHFLDDQHIARHVSRVQGIRDTLANYIDAMKDVANAYFHRIPSTHDYRKSRSFEAEINVPRSIDWKRASDKKVTMDRQPVDTHERVIKISATGKDSFNSMAGEVWIAWYHGIPGIVLDLMRNAVYATTQIADPWDQLSNDMADMWVRVDYGQKYVDLILANASNISSSVLFPKLKAHRWSPLVNVGGSVEPVDLVSNRVCIRVRIPYAAYLNS